MISIMMRLRSCKLGDSYVQVRLKTPAPVILDPAAIPVIPVDATPVEVTSSKPEQQRKKRNRNRRHRKKIKNKSNDLAQASAFKSKTTQPPSLDIDFPSLSPEHKVEWGLDSIHKELHTTEQEESSSKSSMSKLSDAASTATTVSTSVDSCRRTLGGYAAAVLKPKTEPAFALARKVDKETTRSEPPIGTTYEKESPHGSNSHDSPTRPSPMLIQPPSWGTGRTFADVMRSC